MGDEEREMDRIKRGIERGRWMEAGIVERVGIRRKRETRESYEKEREKREIIRRDGKREKEKKKKTQHLCSMSACGARTTRQI